MGTGQLVAVAFGVRNKYPGSLSPLPDHSVTSSVAPGEGQRAAGLGLHPPAPAPPHSPCTHSLSSPLSHSSWTRSHTCVLAHTLFTCMLHPAGCYLLTSTWCTPTFAPVAVSHPEHTQPGAHSPPVLSHISHVVHTHSWCTLNPSAHSPPVHTQSWCTLTPGAISHVVHTHPRCTLNLSTHSLLLPSRISHVLHAHPRCTAALALVTRSPQAHTHPRPHSSATPSPPHALLTPSQHRGRRGGAPGRPALT